MKNWDELDWLLAGIITLFASILLFIIGAFIWSMFIPVQPDKTITGTITGMGTEFSKFEEYHISIDHSDWILVNQDQYNLLYVGEKIKVSGDTITRVK